MADFLVLVIIYVITFSATAYIFLFGDADYHKHGIVGKIRTFTIQIGMWIFDHMFPKMLQESIRNAMEHLLYTRNCYLQVFYLLLLAGITYVYSANVNPMIQEYQLPIVYTVGIYTTLAINFLLYVVASFSDPGEITIDNQPGYYKVFEFDGVMYVRGTLCRTCRFEKPARSKHCAYCDRCVHRFDHHCSWVNNCIGGGNVHVFLLLLISITLGSIYGSFVIAMVLISAVRSKGIMQASYLGADGKVYPVTRLIAFQHMFMEYPTTVMLMTCLCLLSVLVGAFASYHIYLAFTNQTTNERYKWHTNQTFEDQRHSKCTVEPVERTKSGIEERSTKQRTSVPLEIHTQRFYSRGIVNNLCEVFFPTT